MKRVDKRLVEMAMRLEETERRVYVTIQALYDEEIQPVQQVLEEYPPVIKRIYADIDLLFSEGQASPQTLAKIDALPGPRPFKPDPNMIDIEDPLPVVGHVLVSGQSGGGKTNALMLAARTRLLAGHQVHIIDSKNELAQIFERHAKVYTPDQTAKVVKLLVQAAKDRMQIFSDTGRRLKEPCRDIWEYERLTGKEMPVISLVVEELILLLEYITSSELTRLYVAGRSSGVFVFAATQMLKANIIERECSINITRRVYLGAPDKIAMRVMFPGGIPKEVMARAEQHLGPAGHGLMFDSQTSEFTIIKLPRVPDEMLAEFMQ